MDVVFIIGSPRSGTTVLGNILSCHNKIAEWYEPYYMWSYFIGYKENDIWYKTDLTSYAKKNIQREFAVYQRKSRKPIIVDKTPGNAFHIDLIRDVFPNAKWIHLIRDGRDVTLSIKKEWEKRKKMVHDKDYLELFRTAIGMLKRQPYLKYRIMAVIFEMITNRSLDPKKYLNKSKWKGRPYWGPRFNGWEEFLRSHSSIEFNAMQWLESVEAVNNNWTLLPQKNKIEIRYEDLLKNTEETLCAIFDVLKVEIPSDFIDNIPKLQKNNTQKWKRELSFEERKKIYPILKSKIEELGFPIW